MVMITVATNSIQLNTMKIVIMIVRLIFMFIWEFAENGALLVAGMGFLPIVISVPCTIAMVKYVHLHGFTNFHAPVVFATAYTNRPDLWVGFGTYICCTLACLWGLVWVVRCVYNDLTDNISLDEEEISSTGDVSN